MKKACTVSTMARGEMHAAAITLAFDASINLGKRAVIDAIATTLDSLGDPLDRLWIEDASARRRTCTVDRAMALLSHQKAFRYLWAAPASERRNTRSEWLTAVMVDHIAVQGGILFFALPRGSAQGFLPHVTLLKSLAQAGFVPQYGWAYTCQYDKPDYFAFDYAYNNRVQLIEHTDWQRRARGMILDVFPINVLSEIHLRQKLGDVSLKEWIRENTGPESLMQIAPGCFTWSVPAAHTAAVSARLARYGLTIHGDAETLSRPSGPEQYRRPTVPTPHPCRRQDRRI